jgi:hypothetical protein
VTICTRSRTYVLERPFALLVQLALVLDHALDVVAALGHEGVQDALGHKGSGDLADCLLVYTH